MTDRPAHETRLERILGVPLAEDAKRQWPQSGEVINGRARIGEVESHFEGLRLGVGRRHRLGDTLVVEWSTDYGDGRVYRNVSVAELRDGQAVRVTDYWGEPFEPPAWREELARSRCRRTVRGRPPRGCRATTMPLKGGCLPVLCLVRTLHTWLRRPREADWSRSSPREEAADPAARRDHLADRRRCAPIRCLRLRAAAPGRPPDRRRGHVTQHSDFKADPWGRLLRTLDYTSSRWSTAVRSSPGGWAGGCARRTGGSSAARRRAYHALEPGPWAWAHATLAESIIRGYDLFCRPRSPRQTEAFWAEWRRMGRLIESATRTCPSLARAARLLRPDGGGGARGHRGGPGRALLVARSGGATAAGPAPRLDLAVVRWPSTRAGSLTTLGMLPPTLRDRLGVEWSASRAALAAIALARRAGPLMPPSARSFGPHYLRWRGAIAGGAVASADGRGGHGLGTHSTHIEV